MIAGLVVGFLLAVVLVLVWSMAAAAGQADERRALQLRLERSVARRYPRDVRLVSPARLLIQSESIPNTVSLS